MRQFKMPCCLPSVLGMRSGAPSAQRFDMPRATMIQSQGVNNAGFKRALEIYNEIPCMGHLAHAGNFIDLHTEEQFLNSRYSKEAIAVIMRWALWSRAWPCWLVKIPSLTKAVT